MTLQEKQKAYWNAHFETIRLLSGLGIKWPSKQRIPTFYLRNKIRKLYADAAPQLLTDITYLLDVLVRMRTEGAEPTHTKEGFYT
jgi:hypothetical protein